MNRQPWRWLRRLPRLLDPPRPEPEQQARRITAVQRNIIPPVKLVVIGIVFYYLFSDRWWTDASSTSVVVVETMQYLFGAYVLFSAAVMASFYVVRRFPPGFVQWIVFAAGLMDGLFLGGLTLLTGGFGSILYWVFPGVIMLNAICIPLATPQIVLNLSLCAFYLAAGLLDLNLHDTETSPPPPPTRAPKTFNAADIGTAFVVQLKAHSDPVSKLVWNRLSEETREKLAAHTGTDPEDEKFRKKLADELNQVTARHIITAPSVSEVSENPAEPFVLRLAVLLLLIFCCYGVQVLAASRQTAEEEQREFISRTERLHAAGRLAAEIAHQIKNPLGIINNAAFSLQRALRDGKSDVAQQIQIIQEEVERSDRIITQLIGYAQLSEGRVEKLSVTEELERAIEQVFPRGAQYEIQIHRDFASHFPPLLMQRAHLNQVLVNLLQNAREALQGKGNIYLRAHCHADYSIEVVIRDDGPGIAADKLGRIFEAYFTNKEKGTGLGLAIVKHNVELYGGTVRVESELGKGARFVLLFPAKILLKLGP